MAAPGYLTSFCSSCDVGLAENIARLPPEDVAKIITSVRMMTRILAASRGIEYREAGEQKPPPIVQLRIVRP